MIERELEKEIPVVRAMPNTPCVLGAGMTALARDDSLRTSSGNGIQNSSTRWGAP